MACRHQSALFEVVIIRHPLRMKTPDRYFLGLFYVQTAFTFIVEIQSFCKSKMFKIALIFAIVSTVFNSVLSFVTIQNTRLPRVKPVCENFFLDIAEDPEKNTPKQLYGEVAYKSFVGEYKPDALLLGGEQYDIITRVRQLKLLSLTAESGLLQALEAKGVTLSQIEKLLPLVDELGLLPLLVKNKELLLSLAPLLIEPAPLLLPVVVSVLKTPPASFTTPGLALVGAGLVESFDNVLVGAPLTLLGLPLLVIGSILGGVITLPTPSEIDTTESETPAVVTTSRPTVSSTAVSTAKLNGSRKVIKIN